MQLLCSLEPLRTRNATHYSTERFVVPVPSDATPSSTARLGCLASRPRSAHHRDGSVSQMPKTVTRVPLFVRHVNGPIAPHILISFPLVHNACYISGEKCVGQLSMADSAVCTV